MNILFKLCEFRRVQDEREKKLSRKERKWRETAKHNKNDQGNECKRNASISGRNLILSPFFFFPPKSWNCNLFFYNDIWARLSYMSRNKTLRITCEIPDVARARKKIETFCNADKSNQKRVRAETCVDILYRLKVLVYVLTLCFFVVNLWILQFCMRRELSQCHRKKNNWIIAFTGNWKKLTTQTTQEIRKEFQIESVYSVVVSARLFFFTRSLISSHFCSFGCCCCWYMQSILNMFDEKIAKVLQLHKSFEYINEKFVVRCFVFICVRLFLCSISTAQHTIHFNSNCFSAFSMQSHWYIFSNLNYVGCSLHKKTIQKRKRGKKN